MANSFKGTETDLYAAIRIGVANCRAHLAAFAARDTTYTDAYLDDLLLEADAAEAIPDDVERTDWHASKRPALSEARKAVTDDWQLMKLMMEKVWEGATLDSKLSAAGQAYYPRAGKDSWMSVLSLITDATSFLDNHIAELTAKGLPVGFQAGFAGKAQAFTDQLTVYRAEKKRANQVRDNKEQANLDIYNKLIMMLDLGKRIFINEPVKFALFSYDNILGTLKGFKMSGVKGKVSDSVSGNPVAGVELTVRYRNKSFVTGSDGKFMFALIKGIYNIEVVAPGFEPVVVEGRRVRAGVMGRLDLRLTPVAAALELAAPPAAVLEPAVNGLHVGNGVHV